MIAFVRDCRSPKYALGHPYRNANASAKDQRDKFGLFNTRNVRSLDLTTAYLHTSHQLLGGDENFWFHFWIKHDIPDLLVDIDSLVFANL